jgi:hypothetical protein
VTLPHSPANVVQRQLDAYNAKDIPGWLATYAPDAQQFTLHGACFATGHEQMGARIAVRFQEPDLHAGLISRTVMGNIVIDLERITRNFADGRGTVEMLCVYEIADGLIQRASFALGEARMEAAG